MEILWPSRINKKRLHVFSNLLSTAVETTYSKICLLQDPVEEEEIPYEALAGIIKRITK